MRLNSSGSTKTTFADKLVLLFFIALSLSSFFFVNEVLPQGSEVRIEVAGELKYTLPLSDDRIISVEGPMGTTIIEVKNKRVRVVKSPCPNKICLHQDWIERGAVVCLPNKVLVTITGPQQKKEIDGITG
ncbi:MAG: NusG domain II-containing protein [Nitrospirota bacterium]